MAPLKNVCPRSWRFCAPHVPLAISDCLLLWRSWELLPLSLCVLYLLRFYSFHLPLRDLALAEYLTTETQMRAMN